MQFLMDNSIILIFLIAASILGYSEYKKYLQKQAMSPVEFRSMLRLKLNEVGNELLAKFAVSVIVSIVISLVSFRELWMNDTFHIVFLTNLLSRPTWKYLKRLFN